MSLLLRSCSQLDSTPGLVSTKFFDHHFLLAASRHPLQSISDTARHTLRRRATGSPPSPSRRGTGLYTLATVHEPANPAPGELTWVEALVARGLERPAEAEELFLAVVDGFGEDGRPYDMALAGLELGTLYAEQGRMNDILELVRRILPVFVDRHIHREAIGALLLLEEAAANQRAHAALVTQLTNTVAQARRLPRR